MEGFEYDQFRRPGADIRILQTREGANPEQVECQMVTYGGLDTIKPSYCALSYTWGDEVVKLPILLNGKLFYVTANLHSALRHLPKGFDNYYWIDAICINQNNNEERNQQVERMRFIYRDALYVRVWLGPEFEPADQKMSFNPQLWGFSKLPDKPVYTNPWMSGSNDPINLMNRFITSFTRALSTLSSEEMEVVYDKYLKTQLYREFDIRFIWATLTMMLRRAWFDRLWVIQEVVMAKALVFQCGSAADIHLRLMEQIVDFVLRPRPILPAIDQKLCTHLFPLMGAERFLNIHLGGVDRSNILAVLRHTRKSKCKDPRDRLYAIQGIISDNADIIIDYASSVETVYTQWATRKIERTASLDVLSACSHTGESGLPSWVPDLREPWGNDRPLFCKTHMLSEAQQNLPDKREQPWTSNNPEHYPKIIGTTLRAWGASIDTVRAVGIPGDVTKNIFEPTKLREGLIAVISSWEETCATVGGLQIVPTYPENNAGGPLTFSKASFLFADALLRGYTKWGSESHPASLMERFHVWRWGLPVPWNYVYDHSEYTGMEKYLEHFERILFPMVHECQMFITRNGSIGVVGSECQIGAGDEIFGLAGGNSQYLMRYDKAKECYRLVGPCYVSVIEQLRPVPRFISII